MRSRRRLSIRPRPLLVCASMLAATASGGTTASAATPSAPPRITLSAPAKDAAGRVLFRRSVRLDTLERSDVRVVSRTSSSVTVVQRGAGKDGPRATLRVRIVPGRTDVVAHVRSLVPDSDREGFTTGFELQPRRQVTTSAFRLSSSVIPPGFRFRLDHIAAAQLRDQYFMLKNALVELRVTGVSSVGTNSFRSVPGLVNTVRSFEGGTPR